MIVLDTLVIAERLSAAGLKSADGKAVAQVFSEQIAMSYGSLATKSDIDSVKADYAASRDHTRELLNQHADSVKQSIDSIRWMIGVAIAIVSAMIALTRQPATPAPVSPVVINQTAQPPATATPAKAQ